jgi:hypothetical protein
MVAPDLSPGKCSYRGEAWVTAVHGSGGRTVCDVRYIESAAVNVTRKEKAVPLSRLTVTMPAWNSAHLDDGGRRESKR